MQLKSGQTLLFIGNSITDCGRRGAEAPLGNGYVKLFSMLMTVRHPELQLNYLNQGIRGNRVTDLQKRWQEDVLQQDPDFLSIKIGINDVHSYLRKSPGAVDPQLFAEVYHDLLERTKRAFSCPILLIDPFYNSTDRSGNSFPSQVLEHLPHYIDTVHRLSQKYGTMLVRMHDIFQHHLCFNDPDVYCPEPVHPNMLGHLLIAEAVYATVIEGREMMR
jgi:lysophospholipase L1-like esterase